MEGEGPRVVPSMEGEGFTISEQWQNELLTFPDKLSSVPEAKPNSGDEFDSEDKSVAQKGRKCCFREEWLHKFYWLRYIRETNSMNWKFCSRYPQHVGNTKLQVMLALHSQNMIHWSNTVLVSGIKYAVIMIFFEHTGF